MSFYSRSSLPLIAFFLKRYPSQSFFILCALLLAGIAETIGIGALLPLIAMTIEQDTAAQSNALQDMVLGIFGAVGIEPALESLLLTIVAMIVLKSIIVFFALRYSGYVAAELARDYQIRLMRNLMAAKWSYFSGLPLGAVSNAVAAESQRAGHSYMLACKGMSAFIQILIYLMAAFIVMWSLSLLALALGAVLLILVKRIIGIARTSGSDLSTHMDTLLSRLNDSLSGVKPLKAMGQEGHFCEQLEKQANLVLHARKRQYFSSLLIQTIYEPTLVICVAIGLYFALSYTDIPIAEVFLLAFLFHRLMGYVNLTQMHYQNMVQNENAVWALEKQIKAAGDAREDSAKDGHMPVFKSAIKASEIAISYDGHPAVLSGFNATIPHGKMTLLFGPSGAGKTTFMDAVLGLLPLDKGIITIDGVDLKTVDQNGWRQMIGYVPQDSFLFHDTIAANITLEDERYSKEDIIAALKQADAYDFVMAMNAGETENSGIHSIVGERGGKLSGGQRQRLILARALIRKPALLILDEPTSALDQQSEALILDALKNLPADMTVILISHDPKVKNMADHVIEFEKSHSPS